MSVAAPTTAQPQQQATTLSAGRRAAVWALLVAAAVVAFVSILTMWVNRQLLSNQAWTQASRQVIESPRVQNALAIYTVNQLYDNVDIEARLQQRLPSNLDGLAAPLAAALRQPTVDAVGFLLARPRLQDAFVNASSIAHQKLVNVLEDNTGAGISTGNGVVTLNLSTLIRQVGTELGLPSAALDRLPPDSGVITLMRSDQLKAAQTGVRAIHVLSVWLLVLVLGLEAAAIWLARGRRRETLRSVGWSFVLVGLATLAVRRVVGEYAIGQLSSPQYRRTADDTWLIVSAILGQIGWAAVLYGAVAVLGALLAGPTRAATAVRRRIAPTLNHSPGTAAAVVGGLFLLAVLWGGTHALRTWWGVLLLGGLLAFGVYSLRRQTLREFASP